ncbi:calcium release-activated calcium channel protein 1-like isoform X2 [Artemia franciscana]
MKQFGEENFFNNSLRSKKEKTPSKRLLLWTQLHLANTQLKLVSQMSALMAGFGMVAMVEISIREDIPDELSVAFATITSLFVMVHSLALIISTCIRPHTSTISESVKLNLTEYSPLEIFGGYIQFAWTLSTVVGTVLFILEVSMLCWMQFIYISENAIIASNIIALPALAIFAAFTVKFHWKIVELKERSSTKVLNEMQNIATVLSGIPLALSKEIKEVVIDMPDEDSDHGKC